MQHSHLPGDAVRLGAKVPQVSQLAVFHVHAALAHILISGPLASFPLVDNLSQAEDGVAYRKSRHGRPMWKAAPRRFEQHLTFFNPIQIFRFTKEDMHITAANYKARSCCFIDYDFKAPP